MAKEQNAFLQDRSGYMMGQFLLAMPHMQDPRFEKVVIYICGHDANGAMGLIINKHLGDFTLKGLLEYLNLPRSSIKRDIPICFGGPLDTGRGFVLHSDDFQHPGTVLLTHHIALTATIDVLQSIAKGDGPIECLLAMGYVGWEAGQLDAELHSSRWLQVEADIDILFKTPLEKKMGKNLREARRCSGIPFRGVWESMNVRGKLIPLK